jgi:hypothetical protein
MGLKVRVKHPLGEKSLVLPPRAVEKPVTVGRSSSADVQVPSIHIAPVQCVMFVHGGKWVVQDAGGESSGTIVNGHAIAQPTVLKIGDLVTLGMEVNAPSLKVEGVGAGAAAPGPAPVQRKAVAAASVQTAATTAGPSSAFDEDVVTDDSLGAAAASYQSKKFYVPKGPRMSPTALTAGIMVALALVVVIVVLAYKFNQQSSQAAVPAPKVVTVTQAPPTPAAPATPPAPAPKPTPAQPRGSQPLLAREEVVPTQPPPPGVDASLPDQPRKPFANANSTTEDGAKAEKASAATTGAEAPAAAADDPKKKDTEWQRVEEAYKFLAPQAALLVFEDYRGAYPTTPYAKDIAKYTEETLDLLWWHRIKALCDARDITQEEIKKLDRDIAIENNKDYRAKLIKQRADVQERKKQTEELIVNEFAFKEKDPPDLYNANTLAALRAKRDKTLWENFKKSVMESIRRERKVPWE